MKVSDLEKDVTRAETLHNVTSKFIVSYDLRGEKRDENYDTLEWELKNSFNAKSLLDSVWGLSSNFSYDQLFDAIYKLPCIRAGDRLIVIDVRSAKGIDLKNKLSSF